MISFRSNRERGRERKKDSGYHCIPEVALGGLRPLAPTGRLLGALNINR